MVRQVGLWPTQSPTCVQHHVEHLFFCFPKEWQQPRQEGVEANTQAPHIRRRAIIAVQHLCRVMGGGGCGWLGQAGPHTKSSLAVCDPYI